MGLVWQGKRLVVKTAEIVGGLLFLSAPVQALWRRLPSRADPASRPSSVRMAVVAHVYYPELLPDVLACWAHVRSASDVPVPLHITTVERQVSSISAQIGEATGVILHVLPNRGRDIAPFISLLQQGVLDDYDAVLKLHTKRSPHLWTGNLRRRLLFAVLAGTTRQVDAVRHQFQDRKVGVIGWRLSYRCKPSWWMGNQATVAALCQRARPQMALKPGFFEGSMFWVRPAALGAVRSLNLTVNEFEPEPLPVDGALQHAVERIFTLAAWADGYQVRAMSGAVLSPGPQTPGPQTDVQRAQRAAP
jgi:lipopolysaccharide biosynthesis protein